MPSCSNDGGVFGLCGSLKRDPAAAPNPVTIGADFQRAAPKKLQASFFHV
jgi:hypothetical protein